MVTFKEVTLDWRGPTPNRDSIPGKTGIYMVLSGKPSTTKKNSWAKSTYKILDIGQTEDVAKRFNKEDVKEWQRLKGTETEILFKFAEMPLREFDDDDRRMVECCLRFRLSQKFVLAGKECEKAYKKEYAVKVINDGNKAPLDDDYTCLPGEER